jgi:hypothetical protein
VVGLVDEILRVDPVTGKALEARMARGVQIVEDLGNVIVVHYVDDDYVMQRIEIPKSEVTASEEIDVEKLKRAIERHVEELRRAKKTATMLEEKLRGYTSRGGEQATEPEHKQSEHEQKVY